jgi:hypothetical protein
VFYITSPAGFLNAGMIHVSLLLDNFELIPVNCFELLLGT